MIFVTVGTQLPFDRLVSAMDRWADQNPHERVDAQIGASARTPRSMTWARSVEAPVFRAKLREASVVVAHAGMGTILSALDLGKPVIIMPRRAALGEHRNDHQLATAANVARFASIHPVDDEYGLHQALSRVQRASSTRAEATAGLASSSLLSAVRGFVAGGALAEPQTA